MDCAKWGERVSVSSGKRKSGGGCTMVMKGETEKGD